MAHRFSGKGLARLAAAFLLALLAAPAHAGLVVSFQFDATPHSEYAPPPVGGGTAVFERDPGTGTFALTSLGAFSLFFEFGPDTFTQADIVTPLDEVDVRLVDEGNGQRRFWFSNLFDFGSGPFGGSLDLVNPAGSYLSFGPPAAGIGFYSQLGQLQQFPSGDYLAHVVPEPGACALWGVAALALGTLRRLTRPRRV